MPRPITAEERAAVHLGNSLPQSIETSFWGKDAVRAEPEPSVKYYSDLMRVSGHRGQAAAAFAAIAKARAEIAALHCDPAAFKAQRSDIADLQADLLQPKSAQDEMLRFVPAGKPAPRLRAAAGRMLAFERDFGDMIRPAADWLAGQAAPDEIGQADLGVIAQFSRLCATTLQDQDLLSTLSEVLHTVQRVAGQAGVRVVAIPDFAFGMLENRPDHILSFHTAGRFAGFTHFKRGDLPGFMVLDAGGYSGWSTLSGADLSDLDLPPLPEAKAICRALWQDIVAANISKYSQDDMQDPGEPLPESYVFVPFQVATDRTQAMARMSLDAMLDMVLARFAGSEIKVVVKPHPKSADLDQLGRLIALAEAGKIVLRFDSIHRLIAGSAAVITVNSGVGSEAMLHGKPIYCCGAADYDPIAHHIVDAAQFADLTTPIRPAVTPDDLTRFTAYYRKSYLVEWQEPGRLEQAIRQRVIEPILAARG